MNFKYRCQKCGAMCFFVESTEVCLKDSTKSTELIKLSYHEQNEIRALNIYNRSKRRL